MKSVKIVLFIISLSTCSIVPADVPFDRDENQTISLSPMPNFTKAEFKALFGDYFRHQDSIASEMPERIEQTPDLSRKRDRTPKVSDEQPRIYRQQWTCQMCEKNFLTRELFRKHAKETLHNGRSVEEAERLKAKKVRPAQKHTKE